MEAQLRMDAKALVRVIDSTGHSIAISCVVESKKDVTARPEPRKELMERSHQYQTEKQDGDVASMSHCAVRCPASGIRHSGSGVWRSAFGAFRGGRLSRLRIFDVVPGKALT